MAIREEPTVSAPRPLGPVGARQRAPVGNVASSYLRAATINIDWREGLVRSKEGAPYTLGRSGGSSRYSGLPSGADDRRATRQERSRTILADFEPWLRGKLELISQKSKLAEAIRYALSRWEGLTQFIDDGRIEIDSNTVERSIRPITLDRKNALFAGSDGGGENWAVIASPIETCKLCGVDPHAYLADVFAKIVNGHSNSAIDDLLPWDYVSPEPLKAVA